MSVLHHIHNPNTLLDVHNVHDIHLYIYRFRGKRTNSYVRNIFCYKDETSKYSSTQRHIAKYATAIG